jgi:hypothetical protein
MVKIMRGAPGSCPNLLYLLDNGRIVTVFLNRINFLNWARVKLPIYPLKESNPADVTKIVLSTQHSPDINQVDIKGVEASLY